MKKRNNSPGVLTIIKGLDFGGQSGGSDKFGFELCLCLKKMGCNSALLVFNRFGTEREKSALNLLKSENIPLLMLEGKSAFPKLINKLVHLFCREYGLAIAHSHFQVGSLLAVILKKRKNVKKILRTAHITQEWGKGLIPWAFRQVFTKHFFPKWFDAQIGVSQAVVNQIKSYKSTKGSRNKIDVIYNGIPLTWFEKTKNKERDSNQKYQLIIGAIGLLVPRKGFKYLLQAMPKIIAQIHNCHLIVLGDGPQRNELKNIAKKLNIENYVSFEGQRDNMRSWLTKMDILVLPSLAEGLPTVILESMATKVPVIATDIKGSRELVIDEYTGWLVPTASPDEIANKVVFAFTHSEKRNQVIEQAYQWAKKFTIEKAASQYMMLYDDLL